MVFRGEAEIPVCGEESIMAFLRGNPNRSPWTCPGGSVRIPPVKGEVHQGAGDQAEAVGVEAEKDPHENHPAADLLVEVLL